MSLGEMQSVLLSNLVIPLPKFCKGKTLHFCQCLATFPNMLISLLKQNHTLKRTKYLTVRDISVTYSLGDDANLHFTLIPHLLRSESSNWSLVTCVQIR